MTPSVPPPPTRFSTTTGCFNRSWRCSAMIRAIASVPPPAATVTTRVMVRPGIESCAPAVETKASRAAAANTMRRMPSPRFGAVLSPSRERGQRSPANLPRQIGLGGAPLVGLGESCTDSRKHREPAMDKPVGALRNESRAWVEVPADDNGDAMIAAMAEAGVDYVFFTSGSEIGFYQEAVAKAHAQGRKAPKLITVTHEHASLNAALGYAAVSGKPAVTAAHVDCGTQHYGGAVHTAFHCGLPVVITGGGSPTSYPGSFRGARDGGGHIWLQQSFDQNSIVRQYTKWDHRMTIQDNVGLMISRALQVSRTEPCGPVYLQLPREVSLHKVNGAKFPTMSQLGVAKPAAPDAEGIREIARRLVKAANPFVLVARSGRNPATVPALVQLCELMALPVAQSGLRAYQCFPLNHPLYMSGASLKDADVVLAL